MSGDSREVDKLYFYLYESPNRIVEKIPITIDKNSQNLEKIFDPIEFEILIKKIGFIKDR